MTRFGLLFVGPLALVRRVRIHPAQKLPETTLAWITEPGEEEAGSFEFIPARQDASVG